MATFTNIINRGRRRIEQQIESIATIKTVVFFLVGNELSGSNVAHRRWRSFLLHPSTVLWYAAATPNSDEDAAAGGCS